MTTFKSLLDNFQNTFPRLLTCFSTTFKSLFDDFPKTFTRLSQYFWTTFKSLLDDFQHHGPSTPWIQLIYASVLLLFHELAGVLFVIHLLNYCQRPCRIRLLSVLQDRFDETFDDCHFPVTPCMWSNSKKP